MAMVEPVVFLDGKVRVLAGDCMESLAVMDANTIDSVVTDPPYALVSVVKRFGKTSNDDDTQTSDRTRKGADGYARLAKGFMGKEWDNGEVAFSHEFWAEVLRVLKPGGHVVAFGGSKTYHRLAVAIEDAGFEIRDSVMWLYGTGFPKSHSVARGAVAWDGWGTALKPAFEPIVLARKPLSEKTVAANVLEWGTGALNIDGCRIGDEVLPALRAGQAKLGTFERTDMVTPERIGRWPANVVHDGSDEVVGAFPVTGASKSGGVAGWQKGGYVGGKYEKIERTGYDEPAGGSAARFFYSAKASNADRAGSKHPTVKPVALMQWLCRLVTPPGGTVLDPFAGSGTTGAAALAEGFDVILCEREAEYLTDIERRMKLALSGPDERRREIVKATTEPDLAGTLFDV